MAAGECGNRKGVQLGDRRLFLNRLCRRNGLAGFGKRIAGRPSGRSGASRVDDFTGERRHILWAGRDAPDRKDARLETATLGGCYRLVFRFRLFMPANSQQAMLERHIGFELG